MSWECAAYRACPVGGHVLDYGCADGRLAKLILGGAQRITGLALNDAIADAARHYGPYDRILLPGEFESDDGTRYDAIFARGTLALVQDLPRVLQTLRARLRPGGVLVCSVHTDLHAEEGGLTQVLGQAGFRLAAWRQKRAYDKVHGHRQTPALPQWRAAFEGAGFRIEREFDIVPHTAYFFFTLIDGLWHQQRGRGSTLGHRIGALLAARPGSVDAMRSFLSGLLRLSDDNSGHAAAVFVASAPP
jgi:SAM-dependent methyltransferase